MPLFYYTSHVEIESTTQPPVHTHLFYKIEKNTKRNNIIYNSDLSFFSVYLYGYNAHRDGYNDVEGGFITHR